MPVPRLLRLQVAAAGMCVIGGIGDVVWGMVMRLTGGNDYPSWSQISWPQTSWPQTLWPQTLCLLIQFVGAGVAMRCWWQWRRVLREVAEPSRHCAACLYQMTGDRCAECGASHLAYAEGALLSEGLALRAGNAVRGWFLLSAARIALGALVVVLGVLDVVFRDVSLLSSLQTATVRIVQGDLHLPICLGFAGFSMFALRDTIRLRTAYQSAARASTASR